MTCPINSMARSSELPVTSHANTTARLLLRRLRSGLCLGVLIVFMIASACAIAAGIRPFTPADDVGLALFEYAGSEPTGGVLKYSADGRYLAVVTERGRLDLNAPE